MNLIGARYYLDRQSVTKEYSPFGEIVVNRVLLVLIFLKLQLPMDE